MKVKGVNLGNWLVLEKWMSPALFEGNYISHYLHTCICRYDGSCGLVSSCCARKDFSISALESGSV